MSPRSRHAHELEHGSHPSEVFLAGLNEDQPDLMQAAWTRWQASGGVNANWSEAFGFPKEPAKVEALIEAVRGRNAADKRVAKLTAGFR